MGDSLSVGRLQEENNKLPRDNQKPLAEESERITKTREKLEKRLKQQDENVTEENVQEGLKPDYVKETFSELLSLLNVKNGTKARDMLLDLADEMDKEDTD